MFNITSSQDSNMVWGHLPSRTHIHSNFYQPRLPLHRSRTLTSRQSKQRTLPTPRLSTSLAIFFSLLFCVQWILLTFGAHRMAQIPLFFPPASGATSSCTFTSPPVALERVMHTYSEMANTNEEQREEGQILVKAGLVEDTCQRSKGLDQIAPHPMAKIHPIQ